MMEPRDCGGLPGGPQVSWLSRPSLGQPNSRRPEFLALVPRGSFSSLS